MRSRSPRESSSASRKQEFFLVVIMLSVLVIVITLIFSWTRNLPTITITKDNVTTTTIDKELMTDVFSHRKDLIAILLGAFGAWIGAGAAYFFGRENLREATSSILKMKAATPAEILMQTTVGDLKPKPLERTFTFDDETDKKVSEILGWLEKDPERFFAAIVDKEGKVRNVVSEEAIYRFLKVKAEKGDGNLDLSKYSIDEVIKFFEDQAGFRSSKALKKLIDAASRVNENGSCALADEKMAEEQKTVAIVVNDKNVPLGYITSAEIWKFVSSRTSK